MVDVAIEFEKKGLKIPIIIGGATTSEIHTAVKVEPHYSGLYYSRLRCLQKRTCDHQAREHGENKFYS
jgi:cobalamin-dependent methionine synthase I